MRGRGIAVVVLMGMAALTIVNLSLESYEWNESKQSTCSGRGARRKCTPYFVIIGAGKSGTSSLFYYLGDHPDVQLPTKKQVMYFDHNYNKGPRWYLSHFPAGLAEGKISGESTPGYLVYGQVSQRIAELIPGARILVVLRDPVERAWSAYQYHYARQATAAGLGSSAISFESFIEMETALIDRCLTEKDYPTTGQKGSSDRGLDLHQECYTIPLEEQLRPAVEKWRDANPGQSGCPGACKRILRPPGSNMLCARSLLGRGLYGQSLHRYYMDFGPKQIQVVCTEDLSEQHGAAELDRIASGFLGLSSHDFSPAVSKGRFNVGGVHRDQYGEVTSWQHTGGTNESPRMNPATRSKLRAWFSPHNEKLFALIGKRCPWPEAE